MEEERPVPGWTGEARDLEGPLGEGPVLPPNAPRELCDPQQQEPAAERSGLARAGEGDQASRGCEAGGQESGRPKLSQGSTEPWTDVSGKGTLATHFLESK